MKSDAEPFSRALSRWLEEPGEKTIGSLDDLFGEKSFGVLFLLLLAVPALPLPTGGVTHVFEVIALLLSLELIVGRQTVWLPRRWRNKKVGPTLRTKALPALVRWVERLERISRVRGATILRSRLFLCLTGLLIFVLTLTAFVAPPFSGLDTLPSLGVVMIALALILEDILFWILGVLLGIAGAALTLLLGFEAYRIVFQHFHL